MISSQKAHFVPDVLFTPLRALSAIIGFCGIVAIVEICANSLVLYISSWGILHNDQNIFLWLNHPIFRWYFLNLNLFFLFFYGGFIVFLLWFYQAYRNLYALDQETDTTPGMIVTDCLIPIVNLREPYIHMRELWQKIVDQNNWQIVKIWWGTMIIGSIAYLIPRIGDHSYLQDVYSNPVLLNQYISVSTFFYSVTNISSIVFIILLLKIVHTVSTTQAERLKELPPTKADHSHALTPDSQTDLKPHGIMSKIMLGIIIAVLVMLVIAIITIFVMGSSLFPPPPVITY